MKGNTKPYNKPEQDMMSCVGEAVAMYSPDVNTMKVHGVEMLMAIDDPKTLSLVIKDMEELIDQEAYTDKAIRMRAFCNKHFTPEFAAEMERRNYLIDQPRPTNDAEFADLEVMFHEIEQEGDMTEAEVERMMAM